MRILMQNTQYSFHISGDCIDISNTIMNLYDMGVALFAPISPNVNWKNPSNWVKTRRLFHHPFQHVHLSATSSDIGLEREYIGKNLVGGAAVLTLGIWTSKISHSMSDTSGMGTFSISTSQGKAINIFHLYQLTLRCKKDQIPALIPCMHNS